MCKNLFVTFLFSVFCFVVSLAQETHEVKNGETLYSVSKQYNVSTSEIIKANPSAKRGLRRGMSIVIPILHESIDTVIYILHSVRPLESFYSIKNKYGTTQEVLLEFNPQLVDGFRSGMTIKIPQFDEVDVTEKIESTPENEAVSYIDELKERKSKFKKKEVYNIAFLLPLYYSTGFFNKM